MELVLLSTTDIIIAAFLMLISATISIVLQLQLEKKLLVATIRTILQLSIIGIILKWLLNNQLWYFVIPILVFMTVIAAHTASRKSGYNYKGRFLDTLFAIAVSTWSITIIGLTLVLSIKPWYSAQYAIPILGLILGNTLTAVALALERYMTELRDKQNFIDTLLSLGATSWEASRDYAQNALSAGMLPTINSMSVVGLVSLPGMMTGQILAGTPPEQAIKYQIITMFFIAAGSALSCLIVIYLTYRRLFSKKHIFEKQKILPPR
ncbi:MAG: iron export ABC transporter permease subunit FetB [Gammaproteobacteria bacterium]|nr:iron export ABC transporter permease subunit FetB [Gammaproteobacteria bacterium]